MSETVILDPKEIALADRAELNLNSGAIRVDDDGVDWGNAEIEAFMAQQEFGEAMIDYRLPNRVISMPMILGATGDFSAARLALQAKCSRINEEGGSLKRILNNGFYGFFDLVKATLKYGGNEYQARTDGFDPDAELVLEALPDFYGATITLSKHEGTGDLSFTETIKGNLPGRADLTVTDLAGQNHLGLAWNFRCRNYSSASTAAFAYEGEALTPLDSSAEVALTGASGGKAVRHNNLSTEWTPVLATQLKAGTYLTHKGSYDVYARVYATAAGALPYLRLVYDVGDMVGPSENDPVQMPGAESFYVVHLGQINLQAARFGTHRWQGVIQARGERGGENIYVDRLWFACADESSGVLRTNQQYGIGLNSFAARDRFIQSEGALTGKVAEASGKSYAAIAGSDTTDFTVDAVTGTVKRTAVLDSGTIIPLSEFGTYEAEGVVGRAVGLALGLKDQIASIDFTQSVVLGGLYGGLFVRALDAENYIRVMCGYGKLWVEVKHTGTRRMLSYAVIGEVKAGTLVAGSVGDELVVFLNGIRINLTPVTYTSSYGFPANYPLSLMPAGGVYLYDQHAATTASTRTYDNLAVWVPSADAVTFANRNTRIATQGIYRQDSAGVAYGPVSYNGGDIPRVPVSGPEARPVEISLKPSRSDFAKLTDSGLDKISAQLAYRPCWSYVPES